MASFPQVDPVKQQKKIITSEAYLQTLQSQGHLCEISKMMDDFSEQIGVEQLCHVMLETSIYLNLTERWLLIA